MDFVTIDVETANSSIASICQIGIACYKNGLLADEWGSYINPEEYFSLFNIGIHGIDDDKVKDAPILAGISHHLRGYLDNRIVVCHTNFDRIAVSKASMKYGLAEPDCKWLDSASVVRKTWQQYSRRGYNLGNMCRLLNYEFKHHDALEDAKAAGHIMLSAIEKSGIGIDGWLRVARIY